MTISLKTQDLKSLEKLSAKVRQIGDKDRENLSEEEKRKDQQIKDRLLRTRQGSC